MNDSYTAPLDDSLFILEQVIEWEKLFDLPAYRHVDGNLARTVLTEGAKFCEQVLRPVNAVGNEQYVRDVRVAAIYEGTNGIQALDLVTRKLLRDQGARFRILAGNIESTLAETGAVDSIGEIQQATQAGLAVLERATQYVLQLAGQGRQRTTEFIASDYCRLTGLVAGAWMWLRIAHTGADHDRGDLLNYGNCARFYAEYLMPEMHALAHRINTSIT